MLNKINRALRVTFLFLIISISQANAGIHFKSTGKLDSFQWTPPTYTTGFKYDIFYYIPTSVLKNPKAKLKSILFMHGGGSSTLTRKGAASVVKMYTGDFIQIAEAQQAIAVFPSSSGLNWNGHTRVFLRELAKLMRTELPVDPNSIALIGHSMGGMGITRNAFFLGDQFSYFMPVAAGMDTPYMTDMNLLSLFNSPYHHIQGIHDHFDIFVERAKLHEQKMNELEKRLGVKSPFRLSLTETDHQYDLNQLNTFIRDDFKKYSRNLYQSDLYGTFTYANQIITENNIQYDYTPSSNYFWLEAKEFTPTDKAFRSQFEAHIIGNQVLVDFKGPHNVKKLRVYLSRKMLNFKMPINIIVNGISKFNQQIKSSKFKTIQIAAEKMDLGFVFDQYVDIDFTE